MVRTIAPNALLHSGSSLEQRPGDRILASVYKANVEADANPVPLPAGALGGGDCLPTARRSHSRSHSGRARAAGGGVTGQGAGGNFSVNGATKTTSRRVAEGENAPLTNSA